MKVRYDPRARNELLRAAEYFDSQEIGLGERFLRELDKAIKETAAFPLAWPHGKYGTRKRILVSPFPYSIHYKIASLLSDENSLVRKDAALALGLLKSQKHAGSVSKLLSAKEDFVRLYAAISLVLMDSAPHLSSAVSIIDKSRNEGAFLNPGDFHPFVAEKGETVTREFQERLKAARAGMQTGL